MIQNTKHKDTYYSDLGSFNRIKRDSLVRSDDAVETFKRHAEDEESTTGRGYVIHQYVQDAEQIVV